MIEHLNKIITHRVIYAGLAGSHGVAAYATAKPEIYVPMAALYALLALKG